MFMPPSRREFLKAGGAALALTTLSQATHAQTSAMSAPSPFCFMPARELVQMLRERKASAREVMSAFLQQIARLNPKVNAIVAKLPDERCLALADEADARVARGEKVGVLHGLPIAIKDLDPVAGFPFTSGSPIYKDRVASEDNVVVER